jgi:hypothetical protein
MDAVRGRLVQIAAGISAAAAGDWSKAEEHFQAATEVADRLGLKRERVDLLQFRAWMHLWRNGDNDRGSARRLLAEAVAEYEEMGMPRHVEVCREMMVGART